MSTPVFEQLCQKLDAAGVEYSAMHHGAEEAPEVVHGMCTPEEIPVHFGSKAIVVKGKKSKNLYYFVLPDDERLDQGLVKELIGERWSFASADDLLEATSCVPGSVPPFGSHFGYKTHLSRTLTDVDEIVFNAGSLTDSIRMKLQAYLDFEQPELVDVTQVSTQVQ